MRQKIFLYFVGIYSSRYCSQQLYQQNIFLFFSSYSSKFCILTATVAIYWLQTDTTANLIVLVTSKTSFVTTTGTKAAFLVTIAPIVFIFIFISVTIVHTLAKFFQRLQ